MQEHAAVIAPMRMVVLLTVALFVCWLAAPRHRLWPRGSGPTALTLLASSGAPRPVPRSFSASVPDFRCATLPNNVVISCSAAMSRFVLAQLLVPGRGPCCSGLDCLGSLSYAAAILSASAGAEMP